MRASLPTPPFDREGLSRAFGFQVPTALVSVLNAICDECETAALAYDRVDGLLGWLLADSEQRYQQTPAELFPIAATGVDGGHFGYVIHAPELGASDYPIARFEPMDGEGAYLLGATTVEAIETQISTNMLDLGSDDPAYPSSFQWWPNARSRLAELGIEPDLSKANRNYVGGDGIAAQPPFLEGWRHLQSSDGVGVFAPSELFNPSIDHPVGEPRDISSVIRTSLEQKSYPATALWLLRECYWHVWSGGTHDVAEICRAMMDVYEHLDRPSLAAVVEQRISRFF